MADTAKPASHHPRGGQSLLARGVSVEEVLPEVVNTRDNGYKAVKYEKIVPLLIESIKELKSEIDGSIICKTISLLIDKTSYV